MGGTQSTETANTDRNSNNQVSLDHLTSNPQYQTVLRNLYSNNPTIPTHPGAFIVNEGGEAHKNVNISIKKTVPIENRFLFDKNSAKIVKVPGSFTSYCLSFRFSSKEDTMISIYYMAREVVDNMLVTQEIINDELAGEPQVFTFYKGTNIELPPNSSIIDTIRYKKEKLCTVTATEFPLIIVLQKKDFDANEEYKLFIYGVFYFSGSGFELKIVRQKLQINGKAYILDDIFGIGESALNNTTQKDSKDCAICLSEKTDTVVFPCKHMCLCYNCAKDLKDRQNQKCPMCRTVVEYFLKLESGNA